jgi:hypothetical protein
VKLFAVHFEVSIREIGELEEPKEVKPLSEEFSADSPMRDAARLFDRLGERMPGSPFAPPLPGISVGGDNMSMQQNVQVAAGGFEELQAILKKFHDVAASLTIESQVKL